VTGATLAFARRFAASVALMVWQGGFTFYAAAVVPIGQRVLGSHLSQGLITQEVTRALNGVGVAALALMGAEAFFASRDTRLPLKALWGMLAVLLGALFALHVQMDVVLGPHPREGFDHERFYAWHRAYLWISTAQWFCGLLFFAGLFKPPTTPMP
jgi:hypothetical protein